MAIAVAASVASSFDGTVNPFATGFDVTMPSSLVVGDMVVVGIFWGSSGGGTPLLTPSGWTLRAGPGTSAYRSMGIYTYPITDATALSNLGSTVHFTEQTTTAGRVAAIAHRVTGVNLTGTVTASGETGSASAGSSFTFGAISAGDAKLYFLGTNQGAPSAALTFTSVGNGTQVGLARSLNSSAGGSQSDTKIVGFLGGTGATSSASVANFTQWGIGLTAAPAAAVPVILGFQAQPNGTDISTTNGGSDTPLASQAGNTGSTRRFSNLHPASGSMGFENYMPNGTASYGRWPYSPSAITTRQVLRFYFYYPSANPIYSQNLLIVRNGSGVLLGVNMTAAQKFQLINATGAGFALGTTNFPLDTLIRVEVGFTVGTTTSNGVVDSWAWYLGHSTTPVESSSGSITGVNLGTTIAAQVQLGYGSQSPADTRVYYDDVVVREQASGLPGPSVVQAQLQGIYRLGGVNYPVRIFQRSGGTNYQLSPTLITRYPKRSLADAFVSSSATRPWLCLHRGGSYNYPEETLYGYQGVADAGAMILEVSLQRSSAGTWWWFHV